MMDNETEIFYRLKYPFFMEGKLEFVNLLPDEVINVTAHILTPTTKSMSAKRLYIAIMLKQPANRDNAYRTLEAAFYCYHADLLDE